MTPAREERSLDDRDRDPVQERRAERRARARDRQHEAVHGGLANAQPRRRDDREHGDDRADGAHACRGRGSRSRSCLRRPTAAGSRARRHRRSRTRSSTRGAPSSSGTESGCTSVVPKGFRTMRANRRNTTGCSSTSTSSPKPMSGTSGAFTPDTVGRLATKDEHAGHSREPRLEENGGEHGSACPSRRRAASRPRALQASRPRPGCTSRASRASRPGGRCDTGTWMA